MTTDSKYEKKLSEYTEKAKSVFGNQGLLEKKIEEAWAKAKTLDPRLKELMENVEVFVEIIQAYIKGTYRDISQRTIIFLIAGILYFVNPFDIIPDILPVIGFTDDAAVLIFILGKVKDEIDKYLDWKSGEGIEIYES